jgi:hypothetical protein
VTPSGQSTSLLPALIGQLLRPVADPAPRISDKRKARMERALVLLLKHGNMRHIRLAGLLGVSDTTAYEDATALIDDRMLSSWIIQDGCIRIRWYGLTPAGTKRAKELKEMEE